jgi:cation/acetate symporter
VFSPAVSGKATSMIKGVDFHWFPLDNPGIVAIPLSFLLGAVGTWIGGRPSDPNADNALHAAMEVRALTGAGAESR